MTTVTTVNTSKGSLGSGKIITRSDANGSIDLTTANTAGEIISAAYISKIIWSCSAITDNWSITRGANTVFTAYGQNGFLDLKDNNLILESGGDAASNVGFSLTGTGNIILELTKSSGA